MLARVRIVSRKTALRREETEQRELVVRTKHEIERIGHYVPHPAVHNNMMFRVVSRGSKNKRAYSI